MRRAITIAVVAVILGGALAGSSWGFISATGKGAAKFHVAEAGGSLKLDVSIKGTLSPGAEVDVDVKLTNDSTWSVRVKQVKGDTPLVTGLPDGCPEGAFGFKPVQLNRTLDSGESTQVTGSLSMTKSAPIACAGADPVLRVEVN